MTRKMTSTSVLVILALAATVSAVDNCFYWGDNMFNHGKLWSFNIYSGIGNLSNSGGNCSCECPRPEQAVEDRAVSLVIAIDQSACFKNHHGRMKKWIKKLINKIQNAYLLEFGFYSVRLSIVQFSEEAKTLEVFKNEDVGGRALTRKYVEIIKNMDFMGQGLNLSEALGSSKDAIFGIEDTAITNSSRFMVVLTNGNDHGDADELEKSIQELDDSGVTVIPVSITPRCYYSWIRDPLCPNEPILERLTRVGSSYQRSKFLTMKDPESHNKIVEKLRQARIPEENPEMEGTSCTCLCEEAPGLQGAMGIKGPPGELLQGFSGASGKDGAKGNIGKVGDVGIKGIPGDMGAKGEKGEQGNVGETGTPGIKGETGPLGENGKNGAQGQKGEVGLVGSEGLQGLEGDAGPQGPPGRQGKKGPQGKLGDKGVAGAVGDQGETIKGNKGNKGQAGDQGSEGLDGVAGLKGQKGDQGLNGPCGTAGVAGLKGEPGRNGTVGNIGLPGLVGLKGKRGRPGLPGVNGDCGKDGPLGEAGPPGIPGEEGAVGREGKRGKKGKKGEPSEVAGPQGQAGKTGKIGKTGEDGLNGADGPTGLPGPEGLRGEPGPDAYIEFDVYRAQIVELVREILSETCIHQFNSIQHYYYQLIKQQKPVSNQVKSFISKRRSKKRQKAD